ncbi:hypothetical protein N1851_025636 [Merluccius polli]|uniref:Reverse transcriptase n=1 Tax=Merluccius polli TaxID=89951 RepID=A0AA47MDJ1_MERPO|nr:hypothetical protein N1851_025636 [Merluccius polli]
MLALFCTLGGLCCRSPCLKLFHVCTWKGREVCSPCLKVFHVGTRKDKEAQNRAIPPNYCKRLRRRLWKLLRVAWTKNFLTDVWLVAEGCFILKEENSTEIKQFRTILLLNVEGKIFFGILARRLTTFMLDNDYMDTSVQKGEVLGVPGYVEHTSIISKIIEDVKRNHGDLTVLWLDLTNAYRTS